MLNKHLLPSIIFCLLIAPMSYSQSLSESAISLKAMHSVKKEPTYRQVSPLLTPLSDFRKITNKPSLYDADAYDYVSGIQTGTVLWEEYLENSQSNTTIVSRGALLKKDPLPNTKSHRGRDSSRKHLDFSQRHIHEPYLCLSPVFGKYLAWTATPFMECYGLSLYTGTPVKNTKMIFEIGIEGHIVTLNPAWYKNALENGILTKTKTSSTMEVNSSFNFILSNKKKLTVTLGPSVGLELIKIPPPDYASWGLGLTNSTFISPELGGKLNFYFCHRWDIAVAYTLFMKWKVATDDYSHYNEAPLNLSLAQLRVGYYLQH